MNLARPDMAIHDQGLIYFVSDTDPVRPCRALQSLFDYLDRGETLEDFLEGFPTVARKLAIQALDEAKHLLLASL